MYIARRAFSLQVHGHADGVLEGAVPALLGALPEGLDADEMALLRQLPLVTADYCRLRGPGAIVAPVVGQTEGTPRTFVDDTYIMKLR